jgi:hypothetical protein
MLKAKVEGLNELFADLPKVTKAATANTLNIVARKVNKELKIDIKKRYNIPAKAMKFGDLVSIKRADARSDIGKAIIFVKKEGRGLIKYGAKQIAAGLSVVVKTSAKTVRGGFIAPLKKGGVDKFAFAKARGKKAGTVTRRTKKGTPYKAAKREILYGPSVADVYTNQAAEKIILSTIDKAFQKTLDEQFNKQFEKGGRR